MKEAIRLGGVFVAATGFTASIGVINTIMSRPKPLTDLFIYVMLMIIGALAFAAGSSEV